MSRFVLLLLPLVVGLVVAGCWSSPSCPPAKCPTATFNLRALDDSSVTWSLNGSPPRTTTGFVPYQQASGGECSFDFKRGEIIRPVGDAVDETLLQGYFDVHCSGGTGGPFDFVFSIIGDYREWPAGAFTVTAERFGMDYFGASAPNQCRITADLKDLVMTVTVETAAGSRAPYPQMVTGDFVRTFRLDFDTSTATATSGGQVCTFPILGQVSLHLTQTAADYVYNPDAPCLCE